MLVVLGALGPNSEAALRRSNNETAHGNALRFATNAITLKGRDTFVSPLQGLSLLAGTLR